MVLLAGAVLLWWLWPQRLGGATTVVVVVGHSMEPTYHTGDVVIARRSDSYRPGDIVAVRVATPSGDTRLIIHRLMEVRPDHHIVTQGDNRSLPDSFDFTTDAIAGKASLMVPKGGMILWLLSRWWMLAMAAGLLATTMLWPAESVTAAPVGPALAEGCA
jgi:signal peptidase